MVIVIISLCLDLTILDVRWPLRFFSETYFIYNYLHIVQKWTKNRCGKLKKNSIFLSTGHGILSSCGSKAHETMVAKCELVLWRTSPVDWIHLIGPLKPYLAENISLQSSDCNILRLAASAIYSDLGVLPDMFSPKRSRWPPIFLHF